MKHGYEVSRYRVCACERAEIEIEFWHAIRRACLPRACVRAYTHSRARTRARARTHTHTHTHTQTSQLERQRDEISHRRSIWHTRKSGVCVCVRTFLCVYVHATAPSLSLYILYYIITLHYVMLYSCVCVYVYMILHCHRLLFAVQVQYCTWWGMICT
jgi:hypothetical protein